jgi:hypothetical protein
MLTFGTVKLMLKRTSVPSPSLSDLKFSFSFSSAVVRLSLCTPDYTFTRRHNVPEKSTQQIKNYRRGKQYITEQI